MLASFVLLAAYFLYLVDYGYIIYLLFLLFLINKDIFVNKIKIQFLWILLYIIFLMLFNLNNINLYIFLENIKYYYGFVFFTIIFLLNKNININFQYIFTIICLFTIAEYFIINFELIPRNFWLTMIYADGSLLHPQSPGHMRAYGLLKNPTMSATFLASIYLVNDIIIKYNSGKLKIQSYNFILLFFTIISLGSGFGYFIFVFVALSRLKISRNRALSIPFFLIFIFILLIINSYNEGTYYRFSLENIVNLFDFKSQSFNNNYNVSANTIFFGDFNARNFSSDMGLFSLYYGCGILGLLIYLYFFMSNLNNKFLFPIFILYFGMLHYPAIFSIPGQILFAFLLTRTNYAD